MPVNFETPDPGIIDRPYVEQIPLEALFKNLAYKQTKFDQGLQEAKHQLDLVNNIPAYGQDIAVKNQMFQKLNQELAKFSKSNLGDVSVSTQLDGLIANFNSSNDITNIYARGTALKKMQAEEEAARLKGEEYYNPGLDSLRKYYNSGVYSNTLKFQDAPGIAPKISDILKTIRENTPQKERNVIDPVTGETHVEKYHDPNDLRKTRDAVLSNMPSYRQYQAYSLNKNFDLSPEEWHETAYKYFDPLVKSEKDNLAKAQKLVADPRTSAADKAKYTEYAKSALDNIRKYSGLTGDNVTSEAIKAELFRQERAMQDEQLIQGMDAVAETPNRLSDSNRMKKELSNKLTEIEHQAWVNSGAQVDAAGNKIINPTENRDNLIPEKYVVKNKDGSTKTVVMDPNLAAYYKYTTEKDNPSFVKDPATGKVVPVDLSKRTWFGMGAEKKSSLGTGWTQINDPTFVSKLLEKTSTTANGVTVTTKNLAYDPDNGKPAIYVKDGRIVYGLKHGETPGSMEFREVPDADAYYRGLYNSPEYKQYDKKILAQSKEHGNIFKDGSASKEGEAPSEYVSVQPMVLASGDTIQAGVKDGKWYNIKTNQPIQ